VRRALLLLAPLPLAVIWNVARLTVLIVLAVTVDPRVVHSFIHGLSGIVAFWACVLSLYAMADREGLRRVFA
jgi:exosortase/archaeosortase family protein